MHGACAGGRAEPNLQGITVLFVEDELDLRELAKETLAYFGATVHVAASAEEALSALDKKQFDVLLADIGLPGVDGLELMRRVRRLPMDRGGGVPGIALTGYAREQDRAEVLAAGYQMHVTKPVEGWRVAEVIVALLATR